MGRIKSDKCDNNAWNVWELCIKEKLWVSAVHVPGSYNQETNDPSGILQDVTKWKLIPDLFYKIMEEFGKYRSLCFKN